MNTLNYQKKINDDVEFCTDNALLFTLENDDIKVEITNVGGSIKSIYAPCKMGYKKNIVTGFSHLSDYKINKDYFGCILGRFSNRIALGKFVLDGKLFSLSINDGLNHLHGGFEGFNKKIWSVDCFTKVNEEDCLILRYLSKAYEEGYPGNLQVFVKYLLNKKNQLIIEYRAETDSSTPVSLSNHSYFNLSGFERYDILDHYLYINAEKYLEKNSNNLPTGKILSVLNSPFNFLTFKKIGDDIEHVSFDSGYDHDFVLNNIGTNEISYAATLKDNISGRVLNIYTDQPALHLYSGNYLDGTNKGFHGSYKKHAAVALETQSFSDSPNHKNFPNTILDTGKIYKSTTIFEFIIE